MSNPRAEVIVDLSAITANIARLQSATTAEVMVVVKADGYGHGMERVARHVRGRGVAWLGVALPSEALVLRAAGDSGRLLAWLATPGDPALAACVEAQVDLGVSTRWALEEIATAARHLQRTARIHLKIDSGLGRAGSAPADWPDLLGAVGVAQDAGDVQVEGVWSHLAMGEIADSTVNADQAAVFAGALAQAADAGIHPTWRHLANSGALLSGSARRGGFEHTMMRCGIAVYGLTPGRELGSASDLGLRPAMTLRARLAQVKRVPAGHGVSYGHGWHAPGETNLGLIPVGYADGIPRGARGAEVLVGGRRHPIVGRIAMDQCVIDLDQSSAQPGDEVIVFGPGDRGEPTAEDWAVWADTIGYEIVTRLGPRVPRRYVGGDD